MIRPPGMGGIAFSEGPEGDLRLDAGARERLSAEAGIPAEWATVRQVHGDRVVQVTGPGESGEADALWTTNRCLPVAVFTADCFGVVLEASGAVGVAHAGWRGARGQVVAKLRTAMSAGGHPPSAAAIGPGIGPCCFEVGSEVAAQFPGFESRTSWDAPSVDLHGALRSQLTGLEVWSSGRCTYHEDGLFSHRVDATRDRLAAVGWVT